MAVHFVGYVYFGKGIFFNFNRITSAITVNIHKHPNICNTQYN